MDGLFIAPAPRGDDYVELGRVGQGRLFKKMILPAGRSFVHPGNPDKKIKVDDALMDSLVSNFQNHVCDIVQVPVCDSQNKHTEDPLRNVGEVIDLEKTDKGLYAVIDARKEEYANELGKTLIGASAMMHMNYADTATGEAKGPTLLHVAVTNRPYLTDLEGYEEVIAASRADHTDEDGPILLSLDGEAEDTEIETPEEIEMPMTKEEMIASLKADHSIDVEALLASATAPVAASAVPVALSNALGIDDKEGGITLEDIAAGVVELSNSLKTTQEEVSGLRKENDDLKLSAAESEVDDLIKAGRILPKQRADMVALSMKNREMFDRLLPEDSIVTLSETGVTTHEERSTGDITPQVDNYVEMAAQFSARGKKPSATV